MMPHAKLAKAQLPQTLLTALHLPQHFARHRATVLYTRTQARCGGAIPQSVPSGLGQRANLQFRQACVCKGRQHLVLLRGALSGTKIAGVVGIHPVRDMRKSHLGAQRLHAFE